MKAAWRRSGQRTGEREGECTAGCKKNGVTPEKQTLRSWRIACGMQSSLRPHVVQSLLIHPLPPHPHFFCFLETAASCCLEPPPPLHCQAASTITFPSWIRAVRGAAIFVGCVSITGVSQSGKAVERGRSIQTGGQRQAGTNQAGYCVTGKEKGA